MLDVKTMLKHSLFGGLLEEQIDDIIPLMGRETYLPGEDIIVEGAPNDKIMFIVEGRVSILKGGKLIYDLV